MLKTQYKELIETRLDELFRPKRKLDTSLIESARYSLLAESKRIRPLLTLTTLEVFDTPVEMGLDAACAIELVHTYSLIHDDLPSMDNDDFRRGIPTLHKVTSEGNAVLVGDYLLTYAFEILSNIFLPARIKIELIQTLSHLAGSEGMIGGQAMDLAMTGKRLDIDQLEFLHLRKTGALIQASVLFGAIIAQVNLSERKILEAFASKLGLLFQIVDDILDVIKPQEKHGRDSSGDEKLCKTTYLTVLSLEKAKEKCHVLFSSLCSTLDLINKDISPLKEIAQKILNKI